MLLLMIHGFKNYKIFLTSLIQSMPKRGRGQARRLAEHLRVQPVVVSQILAGDRHFTAEQGLEVAHFFGLNPAATDYFVMLIQHARASTKNLELYYEQKLKFLREEAAQLKNKVVQHKELNETDKGIFYSDWLYSAVRVLTSIPGHETADAIAARLRLSRSKVTTILDFLVSRGLCAEKAGRYTVGVTATFIDTKSPFINNHRRNWRLKSLEKLSEPGAHDLFYSSPCSLSEEDQIEFRKELANLISQFSARVSKSAEERFACLNIDWFEL